MKDSLGDKLKALESASSFYHDKDKPLYMRLDGRSFSKVTKNLRRPYSLDFITVMRDVTNELMYDFSADLGFCQSDEISLVFLPRKIEGFEFPFGGRQNKLLSVIASATTQYFINKYKATFEEPLEHNINFDARSVSLTYEDTALMMLWRHKDATRNAINQYAHGSGYKSRMHGVKTSDVLAMMEADGIEWDKVYEPFKYGTFFYSEDVVHTRDDGTQYSRKVILKKSLDKSYDFIYDYIVNRY